MPPLNGVCDAAAGGPSGLPAFAAGYGVWGDCRLGTGVYGTSERRAGVYARSVNAMGLSAYGPGRGGVLAIGKRYGVTAVATEQAAGDLDPNIYAGVFAYGDFGTYSDARLVGTYSKGGTAAGYFVGNVFVRGDLFVSGLKSAAVADQEGNLRALYAVESPEPWFEDFGRGDLRDGHARVELDSGFASLVRTDDYHVFVTAEGESNGLYVSGRTDREFEVREQQGGTSTLSFSYRVLARRQDVKVERLEVLEPPVERPAPERELDELASPNEWEAKPGNES